jgi:hypothetical protein
MTRLHSVTSQRTATFDRVWFRVWTFRCYILPDCCTVHLSNGKHHFYTPCVIGLHSAWHCCDRVWRSTEVAPNNGRKLSARGAKQRTSKEGSPTFLCFVLHKVSWLQPHARLARAVVLKRIRDALSESRYLSRYNNWLQSRTHREMLFYFNSWLGKFYFSSQYPDRVSVAVSLESFPRR